MPSPLVFFQLAASDPTTREFLDQLFDWKPAEFAGYRISIRPAGHGDFDVTVALMPAQDGQQQITLFFLVADLWATVARAEELGGHVLISIRQPTQTERT